MVINFYERKLEFNGYNIINEYGKELKWYDGKTNQEIFNHFNYIPRKTS
jgi:hypothetical protein